VQRQHQHAEHVFPVEGRREQPAPKTTFSQMQPVIMMVYSVRVFTTDRGVAADWPSPVARKRSTSTRLTMNTSKLQRRQHALHDGPVLLTLARGGVYNRAAVAWHHRDPDAEPQVMPTHAEIDALVAALVDDSDSRVSHLVHAVQSRGVEVGTVYAELLAPAARHLGELLGAGPHRLCHRHRGPGPLQRLLRQLSPAFGSEIEHPAHGRRIVLTQPDTEQHIFGLSMVAEFFRRDGWDVLGGVAGVGIDAASLGAPRLV
jgi:hypothetical protein